MRANPSNAGSSADRDAAAASIALASRRSRSADFDHEVVRQAASPGGTGHGADGVQRLERGRCRHGR